MKQLKKNDLFQASQLTILLSYSVFAAILIVETFLMGWEIWAVILIVGAMALCWYLHIRQPLTDRTRLTVYIVCMMPHNAFAKIRLSEQNTKQKGNFFHFCLYFRTFSLSQKSNDKLA